MPTDSHIQRAMGILCQTPCTRGRSGSVGPVVCEPCGHKDHAGSDRDTSLSGKPAHPRHDNDSRVGRGIDTITVGQWVFSNIVIRGALDASNAPKGIGFLIRGYGIPVETVIRDCHSYHLEYGILIPDDMEGKAYPSEILA